LVEHLPAVSVDDDGAVLVGNGRPLPSPDDIAEGDLAAVLHDDELVAVYKRTLGRLVADRVVPR
jgi:hypothetical protein